MGTVDFLVVGLGNPGQKYAHSRHNVGFDVVDLLVERHEARLRAGRYSVLEGPARMASKRVVLAKPITFMNESGRAVAPLVRKYDIDPAEQLIVVHDELDLDEGRVKLKRGGGLAGHNGLRSIVAHLHTQDFMRVRIGIGKPPGGKSGGTSHVLRAVTGAARVELDVACASAADAVEQIAEFGIDVAMRTYNASS